MAASLIIEEESGTCTGWVHPHNGYYAGDFSDVLMATWSELTATMKLRRVPAQPQPHP